MSYTIEIIDGDNYDLILVEEQGPTGAAGATGPTGPTGPAGSLPSMTGQSGKYLTNNGTVESWGTVNTTTIVGITGTKAQFDTACTDGDFAYQSDLSSYATKINTRLGTTPLNVYGTEIDGYVRSNSAGSVATGFLSSNANGLWATQIDTVGNFSLDRYSPTYVQAMSISATGAIFTGTLAASNLSGTNTGDQNLSSYATTAYVVAGYIPLATSVANRIPKRSGTTGLLTDSGITIDASDNLTGVAAITASGTMTLLGMAGFSATTRYDDAFAEWRQTNSYVGNAIYGGYAWYATLTGGAQQRILVLSGLGDLTAYGSITGSNLSGTNTGDKTLSQLLPTMVGQSGKYLTNNGTIESWGTVVAPTWGAITGTLSAQTDLQSALNLKAPLASPTFTGTVTAAAITASGNITASGTGTFGGNLTQTAGTTSLANAVVSSALYLGTYDGFFQISGSGGTRKIDVCTIAGLRSRNYANNADMDFSAGNLTASGLVTAASINLGGSTVTDILTATATLNFASILAGGFEDLTISVTGAVVGSTAVANPPVASVTNNITYDAWVSAAGVVTVRASNNNLITAMDPASGTFRATVFNF